MDKHGEISLASIGVKLPDVEKNRSTESDFNKDLIDGCNELRKLMMVCSRLIPDDAIEKKQQGILTGHMVRIYKLYDTSVLLLAQNRLEVAKSLLRLITDTFFNLFYLIRENNSEIYSAFIKSSLVSDKKLLNQIKKMQRGSPSPIESRMLESIETRIKENGYDISDITDKDKKWCKYNACDLAKELGLSEVYELMYRTTSGSIHGDWYEMEKYHLERGEFFQPVLVYHSAKPQIITSVSVLVIKATQLYIMKIYGYDSPNLTKLDSKLEEIKVWFKKVDQQHENFINTNNNL